MFDLSLARGLDYYTGIIYEAVLKGEIVDLIAEQQKLALIEERKNSDNPEDQDLDIDLANGVGTVAAGGRYDNLVGMFDSKSVVPCVGFSIGVERLFTVIELKMKKNNIKLRANQTQVYVMSPQKGLIKDILETCNLLWTNNINVILN